MIVLTFQACSSSFRTHSFVCFVWRYEVFWCAITASCHTCSSISTPKWPLRFQPTSSRPARGSNAPSSSLAGLQLLQKQTVVGKQSRCWRLWGLKLWDEWEKAQRQQKRTHVMGINGRLTVTQRGSQVNDYTELVGVFSQKSCVNHMYNLSESSSVITDWSFDLKWTFSRLCTWGCETFQSRLAFVMKDKITTSNPFFPFSVLITVVKLECLLCGSNKAAKTYSFIRAPIRKKSGLARGYGGSPCPVQQSYHVTRCAY